MGTHENITADTFPRQSMQLRKRVRVIFHYVGAPECAGVIVRDDEEAPYRTLIRLDDGRTVEGTECQYSPTSTSADGVLGSLTEEEHADFRDLARGEGKPSRLTVERLLAVVEELGAALTTSELLRTQARPPWLVLPPAITEAIDAFEHECECSGEGQTSDTVLARSNLEAAIAAGRR